MKQILDLLNRYMLMVVLFLATTHQAHAFYEPNQQRWLNRDPIQERGGINLYTYVANSPIKNIDPLGLDNNFENPTVVFNGNLYSGSWNNNIPDITTMFFLGGRSLTQTSNNGGFFSNPFIFNAYMSMAGADGAGLIGSGIANGLSRIAPCFTKYTTNFAGHSKEARDLFDALANLFKSGRGSQAMDYIGAMRGTTAGREMLPQLQILSNKVFATAGSDVSLKNIAISIRDKAGMAINSVAP